MVQVLYIPHQRVKHQKDAKDCQDQEQAKKEKGGVDDVPERVRAHQPVPADQIVQRRPNVEVGDDQIVGIRPIRRVQKMFHHDKDFPDQVLVHARRIIEQREP